MKNRPEHSGKTGRMRIALFAAIAVLLGFFYLRWRQEESQTALVPCIASACSLLLFLAFCFRSLPGWLECLRKASAPAAPAAVSTRNLLQVLGLLAGCLAVRIALVSLVRILGGKNTDLAGTFRMYTGLDSAHYLQIAREGYVPEGNEALNLVFFPGYPALISLFSILIPEESLAGYLAAWIPFLGAGCALYMLFRLDLNHARALRALGLFCLFPGAVFFAYPMSESLFLLCMAVCLYMARTGRWFAAGIWGLLAAYTRSVGILLLAPMCAEWWMQRNAAAADPVWKTEGRKKAARDFCCLLLVPLGTALYLAANLRVSGSPWTFLEYQKNHWHQQLSWFFRTAAVQTEYALSTWQGERYKFFGLWGANLLTGFASLGLMTLNAGKTRPSRNLFFAAYFLVCYGSSWLLSGPRYMTVFFPLACALEERSAKKAWLRILTAAVLGLLSAGYTVCFAMRWGVW